MKSESSLTDADPIGASETTFSKLANFIPLGSLTAKPSVDLENDQLLSFFEVHSLPQEFNDHELAPSLRALARWGWIRIFYFRDHRTHAVLRVYVLPDDIGRADLDRSSVSNRRHLMTLVKSLDVSIDSWQGYPNLIQEESPSTVVHDLACQDDESLFYIFNTLPSPKTPHVTKYGSYAGQAVESLLHDDPIPGLRTNLYAYQKRTIAAMIRRETIPHRTLDPRLQLLRSPTGSHFYYDSEAGTLLREKREYEDACGGILGESMGLGKTLICLTLVLLTQGHWPMVPPEYSINRHPVRRQTGSLVEMAATAGNHHRIPWRPYLENLVIRGEASERCITVLEENRTSYNIPGILPRSLRIKTAIDGGKKIHLSTSTLIIVPQNLLTQWSREITTHISENVIKVLKLDVLSLETDFIPNLKDILQYDIILMSRQRLIQELNPSEADEQYLPHNYQSPLKYLHFLRVIMDEGHEFASYGGRNNTYWSLQKLHVDRKWIVSGTPASGLIGVEVGGAALGTTRPGEAFMVTKTHAALLEARRKESTLTQERRDLEKLGGIVSGFLRLQPWTNGKDDDPASWSKYNLPSKDGQRKPRSLRTLMESLVVRHRIEDVETDLQLPPLHNRVVYLKPSWHDKLSINLFVLTLIVNAVTSERIEEDYMYHPKNRHALTQLITNLRMAGFYWTSFTVEGVLKTLEIARNYLEEHEWKGPSQDQDLLERALWIGWRTLNSKSWKALSLVHEMGMFVDDFPIGARQDWSLVHREADEEPLLMGATQLVKAQQWTDNHLHISDLISRLSKEGSVTMQKKWELVQSDGDKAQLANNSPSKPKKRTNSDANVEPKVFQGQTVSRAKALSSSRKIRRISTAKGMSIDERYDFESPASKSLSQSELRQHVPILPADSPLAATRLIGTASTKLSYLLDRVLALHLDEKILIFYEGDQIAFYLAQAFDLVSVRYLIYTSTLSQVRQSAYITTFNSTPTFRVLLMNVHQAAHGLHIASASRVFFVNPVWQPNVEAQAIKRAHRIGQTRPVYVETLVLQDTIEDRMLERRKNMTAQEHHKAEHSLLDDDRMSNIIKDANFLPLLDDEINDIGSRIAKLTSPQQLFGGSDRQTADVDDPDADLIFPEGFQNKSPKKARKPARSVD